MAMFPSLRIGEREINPPIIQGGMGVRVSLARLAAAVANAGGIGVMATAGIAHFMDHPGSQFLEVNEVALRQEIRKAREMTPGMIGVNIMVALSNYPNLVQTAVEEGIDMIISGAGLPLDLPKYAQTSDVMLVPIVSSARAFKIICSRWQKRYQRLPDAVVVEGVLAGGHLGFSYEEVVNNTAPPLEDIVRDVLPIANSFTPAIPVIPAGGIFDGSDIARFLAMGASGVQMATRFVCTTECDVHDNFKQAYLDAGPEDITVFKSPVGLPGKVIRNDFVERTKRGERVPYHCKYKCLRTCNSEEAPYCIAEVLANASKGKLQNAFVFAGSNAYRCKEIVSVTTLMRQLTQEYAEATRPVEEGKTSSRRRARASL
jgi:nitronate monooxygenase